ncbi:MAG: hypothetical protein COA79_14085 [Planctomycetota bacterium]|nr:MAG: hypothetical protein COA79_14085 [Planctomycetota bacterium]
MTVYDSVLIAFKEGGALMFWLYACSLISWLIFFDCLMKVLAEKKAISELIKPTDSKSRLLKQSVFYQYIKDYRQLIGQGIEPAKAMKELSKKIDLMIPIFERRLSLAGTLIQVAPLLGLLGTVSGIILTFDALRDSQISNNLIAHGISRALYTTEYGLLIAIPGLYVGLLLFRMVERIRIQFRNWLRQSLHGNVL